MSTKTVARKVIDDIVGGGETVYLAQNTHRIPGLSDRVEIHYAKSFKEFFKYEQFKRKDFPKLHNCAVTYGYRGHSERKQNGIVDIRKTDKYLLRDYQELLTESIIKEFELDKLTLQLVKVVAHCENGNRLVGVLDKTERDGCLTTVLLGVSNYSGKVK